MIDAHVHTCLTDGQGRLEDYVLNAREIGLSAIAFTEHADDTSTWFESYLSNRKRLQQLAEPVRVYLGAEVKLARTDGTLALNAHRAALADFIVGVLHRYPDGRNGYFSFGDLGPEEAMEMDYRLSMALISNPQVDVFGHPGGVYATHFPQYEYDPNKLCDLITTAASNGIVIEFNSNPRYESIQPLIIKRCMELDCMISIGSDAHKVCELGHVVNVLQRFNLDSLVHARRKE